MQRQLRIVLILIILVTSSACYLIGWWKKVPDAIYTGIRPLNASDYNVNLSWIQQSRSGITRFRNLYDCKDQAGLLVRPIYFALSFPFRFTPWSNTVVLHVLRIICGLVLLIATLQLLKLLLRDERVITIAFAMLMLTSGFGVLVRHTLPAAADLSIPEAVPFLTLGEPPHFIYSLLLVWFAITWFYHASNTNRPLLPVYIALFLLWWEHPFDVVTVIVITLVNLRQLDRSRRLQFVLGLAAVSIFPTAYYFQLRLQPSFQAWQHQNVMHSPPISAMITAFAPLILLAIPGLLRIRQERKLSWFLASWIVAQFILSYIPFDFQRRLISGISFPLAVLAAVTLSRLRSSVAIAAIIVVLATTNVYTMRQQIRGIESKAMPYYLPNSYVSAFQWLSEQKADGVISAFVTGNFVPGYSGKSVFIGHSALSPNILERKELVTQFYKNPQRAFLESNQIHYVVCGREEKGQFQCNPRLFRQLYANRDVTVGSLDLSK